jgi:hypothetical protein
MPLPRPRIQRTRSGEIRLRLPQRERDILRELPGQLRRLLEDDDPALERLFPPAYPDDEKDNDEYDRLDESQLTAWIGALNDLRLVLGTRLDVNEGTYTMPLDPRHPQAQELALFGYLTWLQEQAVQIQAAQLPPA